MSSVEEGLRGPSRAVELGRACPCRSQHAAMGIACGSLSTYTLGGGVFYDLDFSDICS